MNNKDWDYFLPRNHVNRLLDTKKYRIFQPQWKQMILFWLGRDDLKEAEKEEFIETSEDEETLLGGCRKFRENYRWE